MGTLRLQCNKCKEMKHWNDEDDFPDDWAFRLNNVIINSKRKYKQIRDIDLRHLFCSEECFNEEMNGK